MIDIFYIVRDQIVNLLDRSLEVNTATLSGAIWGVDVNCSVKWARESKTVTDANDVVFTISAVDYGANVLSLEAIFDEFDVAVVPVGPLVLELPYFFIGTPMRTNEEWKDFSTNEMKKTPFIWMLEPTSETLLGVKSSVERESDVHLVILDSNNSVNWQTKDVHDNRLQALYNLAIEIRETIGKNFAYFKEIPEDIKVKNFTRFGSETAQGFDKNIIDADLTGIETRFTLSVLKQACKC